MTGGVSFCSFFGLKFQLNGLIILETACLVNDRDVDMKCHCFECTGFNVLINSQHSIYFFVSLWNTGNWPADNMLYDLVKNTHKMYMINIKSHKNDCKVSLFKEWLFGWLSCLSLFCTEYVKIMKIHACH